MALEFRKRAHPWSVDYLILDISTYVVATRSLLLGVGPGGLLLRIGGSSWMDLRGGRRVGRWVRRRGVG